MKTTQPDQIRILLWETDAQLWPTGREQIFIGRGVRKVMEAVIGQLGGTLDISRKSLYMADGKRWYGVRL